MTTGAPTIPLTLDKLKKAKEILKGMNKTMYDLYDEYLGTCLLVNYPPIDRGEFKDNPDGHVAVLEDFMKQTL